MQEQDIRRLTAEVSNRAKLVEVVGHFGMERPAAFDAYGEGLLVIAARLGVVGGELLGQPGHFEAACDYHAVGAFTLSCIGYGGGDQGPRFGQFVHRRERFGLSESGSRAQLGVARRAVSE